MRSSQRRRLHNQSIKSRLKTLEKNYTATLASGKKDEAATALALLSSALDKAAKTGVVHRGTVDRKKSRLAVRLSAKA